MALPAAKAAAKLPGWKFGGITADDLEYICLKNGFKVEKEMRKGKVKDIKYQYGEFADWFLHKLI